MAVTVLLALGGAFILSLTFVPVLTSYLVRERTGEHETRLLRGLRERLCPPPASRDEAALGDGLVRRAERGGCGRARFAARRRVRTAARRGRSPHRGAASARHRPERVGPDQPAPRARAPGDPGGGHRGHAHGGARGRDRPDGARAERRLRRARATRAVAPGHHQGRHRRGRLRAHGEPRAGDRRFESRSPSRCAPTSSSPAFVRMSPSSSTAPISRR